jgi:hypothetical protein
VEKLTKFFGWFGFLIGITTAICAPLPGYGALIALICMTPGFLFSSLYVLFSTRYKISYGWFNPGYFGMFLSSTPLIMILFFKLRG